MIIFTVLLKDTNKVIDIPETHVLTGAREYHILSAHVQYCECKNACVHKRKGKFTCCRCMGEKRAY